MMSKTKICLCLMALGCSPVFAQSEAPITGVTLYPGTATVERTARATPGMTQILVSGLPSNFDLQTIRVQADPGIQVGQVVTQTVSRTESANARQAEIEVAIQGLKDREAELDVDANSAELVKAYLEHMNGKGAAETDKQMPYIDAKSMGGVIDNIRRGATDAFDRIQKVEVQKRELEKKIAALNRDLAKVRSGAQDSRTITINMVARQAGAVVLSYQMNGAGWSPTYRAALDSSASTVELERLANVSQKTGEDWSGVKLRLSTGQPRLSPQAPEPRPWAINFWPLERERMQQNRAAPVMSAPVAMPMMGTATKSKMVGEIEPGDKYEPPVIELQGAFATEFEVPAKVTLPADGREISVALSKQMFPVKQRVRVVPRIDKTAVVTAEAKRPDGVWLAGNIQLFRDGNYVGATQWNAQSSEQFVFSFGRDDLVRVAVDRAKEQSGTTGVFTQRGERKVADVYTLTSFHKMPVDILLLESSPVSTSDQVQVQVAYSPKPTIDVWEQRRGVVGLEKTLAPNEAAKFSVDYAISFPKEGTVAGLP